MDLLKKNGYETLAEAVQSWPVDTSVIKLGKSVNLAEIAEIFDFTKDTDQKIETFFTSGTTTKTQDESPFEWTHNIIPFYVNVDLRNYEVNDFRGIGCPLPQFLTKRAAFGEMISDACEKNLQALLSYPKDKFPKHVQESDMNSIQDILTALNEFKADSTRPDSYKNFIGKVRNKNPTVQAVINLENGSAYKIINAVWGIKQYVSNDFAPNTTFFMPEIPPETRDRRKITSIQQIDPETFDYMNNFKAYMLKESGYEPMHARRRLCFQYGILEKKM